MGLLNELVLNINVSYYIDTKYKIQNTKYKIESSIVLRLTTGLSMNVGLISFFIS